MPKEEADQVGDLRYSWKKLRKLAVDVSDGLAKLQVGFKRELIKEVKAFVTDVTAFRADFEANGPMLPGLTPAEAVDRLKKYQGLFEVRIRKLFPCFLLPTVFKYAVFWGCSMSACLPYQQREASFWFLDYAENLAPRYAEARRLVSNPYLKPRST